MYVFLTHTVIITLITIIIRFNVIISGVRLVSQLKPEKGDSSFPPQEQTEKVSDLI